MTSTLMIFCTIPRRMGTQTRFPCLGTNTQTCVTAFQIHHHNLSVKGSCEKVSVARMLSLSR